MPDLRIVQLVPPQPCGMLTPAAPGRVCGRPATLATVGEGIGGYRVARVRAGRIEGQLLFDTARDIAAAARLLGLPVVTDAAEVRAACAALGVPWHAAPLVYQEYLPL